MKPPTPIVTSLVGLLTVTVAVGASAQDWPQWRGAQRDAKAPGFKAPEVWPKELTQARKVAVGDGDSTPALAGGKLYVFTRQEGVEIVRCLDAGSGKELWQASYDALGATGPASRHAGPRSSPTVADGKVLTYGVRGILSCFEAETGKLLWRRDDFPGVWPRFFTASSPVVTDGLVIAQLGGEENGGVVAYALASGAQKWKWTGDGVAYASPVLVSLGGSRAVVSLTARKIVVIGAADGQLLWEAPFVAQRRAYNAATPIVDGQKIIYAGAGRGAKAVKLESSGSTLSATELWSNPDHGPQFNSPVLVSGRLYGVSQAGDLFCLDAQEGKTLWSAQVGGGGFGSVVAAGSFLLALTPQGDLVVFAPGDKEYKPLASYKVGTDTYAYPIPAGNGIYVKDKESVTLWTLN